MTTPTQNEIPSSTAIDVRYNAEKLDEVVNSDNETYSDRFGNSRFTLKGLTVQVSNFFSSLTSSLGAGNIGLKQGGVVQNAVGYITPEMFGAVRDGVTDDTQAFLDAISYASSNGWPALKLSAGTYRITRSIDLKNGQNGSLSGCSVFGDGMYTTGIKWDPSSGNENSALFIIKGGAAKTGLVMTDLNIFGSSKTGIGIDIQGSINNCISNIRIKGFGTCIRLYNNGGTWCEFNRIFNIYFNGTFTNGILFEIGSGTESYHGCSVMNCYFEVGAGCNAIYFKGTSSIPCYAYNVVMKINVMGVGSSLWDKTNPAAAIRMLYANVRPCDISITHENSIGLVSENSGSVMRSIGSLTGIGTVYSLFTYLTDEIDGSLNTAAPNNTIMFSNYVGGYKVSTGGNTDGTSNVNKWSQSTINYDNGFTNPDIFTYKTALAFSSYNSGGGWYFGNVAYGKQMSTWNPVIYIQYNGSYIQSFASTFIVKPKTGEGIAISATSCYPYTNGGLTIGQVGNYFSASYVTKRMYNSTVGDFFGSGSPEGVITAGIGSTYRRSDGGTGTTFYVKESGTSSTGWVAK